MLKLEQIQKNAAVSGIESGQVVRIVTTEEAGENALTVYYKTVDGRLAERMLFRADELRLSLAKLDRPWAFNADGDAFKLAAEGYRINLAYLFDPMMAVHTSNVEPLPHQITAVYESMLPRQPLRFVLADDPGAGKTIMAGLLVRELIMRADAKRVLIVAPGSLVEQWQDEMREKFGLEFSIFTRDLAENQNRNPFEHADLLVARIDQLSRNPDLQEKLIQTQWDLVIVDEAHKMSASWYGRELKETKRFQLGKLLGSISRHFLLMTATPHNGKEVDFQLFLSLLDSDRFYGKFRDGAHKVETADMMRRMVKEDLLKFDGSKLFPERRAYTVNYKLSDSEIALYQAVTTYVKEEMNRAEKLDNDKRKGNVGFALTQLQRRLASSPEAIHRSLVNRLAKLKRLLEEERLGLRKAAPETEWSGDAEDAEDDLSAEVFERFQNEITDQATAADTIQELEAEIFTLTALEKQARVVVHSGTDKKWDELSKLLEDNALMFGESGHRRKLIIFTEHRDTLNYLAIKIEQLLGGGENTVVQIHGGVKREDRRKAQELFRNDPDVRVLIATDAAGEGVNLQNANLMVNYDLPWNPNRLEQRFGRIHRIGQTEVCHLWNVVANETQEGNVYQRLLQKLEVVRETLGGRVFDILGEVFEEKSLRELLIEAIRYGDDPQTKTRLLQKVDNALEADHLRAILKRNALCEDVMNSERLFAIKSDMDKAEARKLQPYFIRAFFVKAFAQLGGELRPRESGRLEITHVPAVIRERDRQISGRDRANANPVLRRYERVCFEKQFVRLADRPSAAMASLIHAGHPLMQAVTDLMLEAHRNTLKQGAVLVDATDDGIAPKVMLMVDHSVKEGSDPSRIASRQMQFIEIDPHGVPSNAGWAPHLDLRPIEPLELKLIADVLDAPWLIGSEAHSLEQKALTHAAAHMVPAHFDDVKGRRERTVERTLAAVHERLAKEINFWEDRAIKFKDDLSAGKDVRLSLDNVARTIEDLRARLTARTAELEAFRNVTSATPVIAGGALVIPAGLLAQRRGESAWSPDAEARKRIEHIAMHAVRQTEESRGHEVIDVSAEKCGWDLTSFPPAVDGKVADSRHIEVKGRAKGQSTITVTRNEVLYGLNQADKFVLAVVLVEGSQVDGPHYIKNPFTQEPDWAVASINLDLAQLLARAEPSA